MQSGSSRLAGIDLAYVLATLGCVAVSYLFVVGQKTGLLDHVHYFPLLDLFPAWFFFMNGLTTTLMLRDSHISSRKLGLFMGKKGTIMILIGLVFSPIWPMNLFLACGVFYVLAPTLAKLNTTILRVITVAVALITISIISFTFIKTHINYSGLELQGTGLSQLIAFVFFNGYYSLLPWAFFFMLGIIHGRGQVRVRGIFQPSNILALFWFFCAIASQLFSLGFYQDREELYLGNSFPLNNKIFLPSFLFFGMASNILLTNACVYMMKEWPKDKFRKWIQDISSMKYSFYFFHLVLGAITMGMFNLETFGGKLGMILYLFVSTSLLFWLTLYWKHKINDLGPIEWLIKRISGSGKP